MREVFHGSQIRSLADQASVGEHVPIAIHIGGSHRSFEIDQDMLPGRAGPRDEELRRNLHRPKPEAAANPAELNPSEDVDAHRFPEGEAPNEHDSLVGRVMCPEVPVVALVKEEPPPRYTRANLAVRNDDHPSAITMRLLDEALQAVIIL